MILKILKLQYLKIAAGMYVNSGQVCTSGTRLIAHKKIVNELVDKLIDLGSQKIPGLTWDDKNYTSSNCFQKTS